MHTGAGGQKAGSGGKMAAGKAQSPGVRGLPPGEGSHGQPCAPPGIPMDGPRARHGHKPTGAHGSVGIGIKVMGRAAGFLPVCRCRSVPGPGNENARTGLSPDGPGVDRKCQQTEGRDIPAIAALGISCSMAIRSWQSVRGGVLAEGCEECWAAHPPCCRVFSLLSLYRPLYVLVSSPLAAIPLP